MVAEVGYGDADCDTVHIPGHTQAEPHERRESLWPAQQDTTLRGQTSSRRRSIVAVKILSMNVFGCCCGVDWLIGFQLKVKLYL